MATQNEPLIESDLGGRAREEVERIASRGQAVLTMGEAELAAILDGVQGSVQAALGERGTAVNYAPAFSLGALFGAALTVIAVIVGAAIG